MLKHEKTPHLLAESSLASPSARSASRPDHKLLRALGTGLLLLVAAGAGARGAVAGSTVTQADSAPLLAQAVTTPAAPPTASDTAKTNAPIPRRTYETKRTARPPVLDGKLDDDCWNLVEWATDFIQWEPEAGKPPAQQTAFKIVYDNDALYIGYRAYDTDPARITRRLARRDWFPGDWVEINIDSRHDGRTGYSFTSSVSGTRGDEFISSDGDSWDSSWDPIWDLRTRTDDQGWTAEVRIPMSQLRFSQAREQVWGIQVQRRFFREEERSVWQPRSRQEVGWVSHFGELHGLSDLGSSRRLELFPYVLGRAERFPAEPGNPFADGRTSKGTMGLDGKTGVDGDLTLDFTLNPDFGQVEADPSEVNLTVFETPFNEKRPFFIEGKNILTFPIAPAITGGSFTQDNLFYSRRIGRTPAGYPGLNDGEFADLPSNTSIIGAAKLTGKTPRGLSVGILESATAREDAEITGPAGGRTDTIEPFTNYFAGRLQQDWRQGRTQLGGMVTAVHRRIDDPDLDFLHRSSWAGGLDLFHRWHDRTWYVAVNGFASRVAGSPTAILRTQRAPARYFQRPDNNRADVDSSRTSLAGYAGSVRFGRSAGQGFRFQTGLATRSPGFEINDLGFMRKVDEINQFTWAGYGIRKPFSIFRSLEMNSNQWINFDSGGKVLIKQANVNSNASFKNSWNAYFGATRVLGDYLSNTELRGGPSMLLPAVNDVNVSITTDSRRRFRFEVGAYGALGAHGAVHTHDLWLGPTWEPSNALRLAGSLDFNRNRNDMQYVGTATASDGPRYLFGAIDQKTLSLVFRVDYTLTPNLTLQYYGAPFISAGSYSDFKRITDPRAAAYADRFHTFAPSELVRDEAGGAWSVDENGDGTGDYPLPERDFNVRDFNSNLVLRWEFQPGSVLFLVWSQARSGFLPDGTFSARHDLDGLFDVQPHNVLLLKASKWFSI